MQSFDCLRNHADIEEELRCQVGAIGPYDCIARQSVLREFLTVKQLSEDLNIKVVSSLLGHSSLRFTEIYVRAVDEEKKKAINSMPSIDIL